MTTRQLAAIAALITVALMYLSPVGPGGRLLDGAYLVVSAVVLAGGWWTVRRRIGSRAWTWILAGLSTWLAGTLISGALGLAGVECPVWVCDPPYLSGYLFILVGLLQLSGRLRRNHELPSLLDAAIVTTGAAVPLVAYLAKPALEAGLPSGHGLLHVGYPLLDVFCLVLLIRLGQLRTAHGAAIPLLTAALGVSLIADLMWNLLPLLGAQDDLAGRAHRTLILGAFVIAVAACWTSRDSDLAPGHLPTPRRRLIPMALGLLIPLLTLIAGEIVGTPPWRTATVGLVTVGLLMLLRFDGLLAQIATQSAELDELARRDPLTGVANRRSWDFELSRAVVSAREHGVGFCVAIIDLDHFKAYNDAYGHQRGDQLLQQMTLAWAARLDPSCVLARVGGEEFALLLPGRRPAEAHAVLEDMLSRTPHAQTCSAGLAAWVAGTSPTVTMAAADAALYEAKRAGRNQIKHGRTDIAADGGDDLQPRLLRQPVALAGDLQVVGFEVLSRFDDLRHPRSVFALAHRNGYGDLLEARVVCAAAELRRADGQVLFVNASLAALTSDRFHQALPDRLHGLVIELAEESRPVDWNAHAERIGQLRARGARIGVDDVGVGSADLVRMIQLRPDYVKLDPSVVAQCATGPHVESGRELLTALVRIAHSVGAQVGAKGIESTRELEIAAAAGVDLVQGFHLGRPECPGEHLPVQPCAQPQAPEVPDQRSDDQPDDLLPVNTR